MNRKVFIVVIVFLAVLSPLVGCGTGICIDQAGCFDGNGSAGGTADTLGSFVNFMASTMHRDKAAAQITLSAERALGTAPLPAGYRKVPRIGDTIAPTPGDDDGRVGGSVTLALRPTTACGTSQDTVAARIAHCAAQNPTRATWDGSVSGNAGQAVWKLVTYNSTHEVWRDERTQLLWSDRLGNTNWCRASGVSGGGPFGQVDQWNICDSGTYQNQVTPESWCTEDPGVNTPGAYNSMKGGMRLATTPTSPSVVWRLPSKWDFHQAEIDGIRFVVPNMAANIFFSATVATSQRFFVWHFFAGSVSVNIPVTRDFVISVACVGR